MSLSPPAESAATGAHEPGDEQQLRQDGLSHEQMAEGSDITLNAWRAGTAFEFWDRTIDLEQPINEKHINTYIGQLVAEYQGISTLRSLIRAYQEDFEGWTTFQFGHAARPFKRAMIERLEKGGYHFPSGLTQDKQLVHPLGNSEAVRTPRVSPRTSTLTPGPSRTNELPLERIEDNPDQHQRTEQQSYAPDGVRQTVEAPVAGNRPQRDSRERSNDTQEVPDRTTRFPSRPAHIYQEEQPRAYDQDYGYGNVPPGVPFTMESQGFPFARIATVGPENPNDPYALPPPKRIYNSTCSPSQIQAFAKVWRKELNYTGKPYDILYDKARMFIAACRKIGITEDQFHAVWSYILSDRALDFYVNYIGPDKIWYDIYRAMDLHFNHRVNHNQYWADWSSLTFVRMRKEHADKTNSEVLEMLLDKMQLTQRALGAGYQGEIQLRTAVERACRGVPELEPALIQQRQSCEELFSDMRAAITVASDREPTIYLSQLDSYITRYLTDRTYTRNPTQPYEQKRSDAIVRRPFRDRKFGSRPQGRTDKKCFVCKKEGCWSTNHTPEERARSRTRYLTTCDDQDIEPLSRDDFASYVQDYEGQDPDLEDTYDSEEEQGQKVVQYLLSASYIHRATGTSVYDMPYDQPSSEAFVLENQYSHEYQGELWDTGASQLSTVGKSQALAWLRDNPRTKVKWGPSSNTFNFGGGEPLHAIGTITKTNPLGEVTYYILEVDTPFLLSLNDADRLGAYFDNTTNRIVRKNDGISLPVVRKWGHPFFNLSRTEASMFLTEQELRRLHRRFGHAHADRLYRLLRKAGIEDVNHSVLEGIQKVCHHCQSYDQAPKRFKFTLKDDHNFNYEIFVDIVHLSDGKALHVIDASTSYQAAEFLEKEDARSVWDALCRCWIFVYLGPPDIISHDPGTNFASKEFRSSARIMGCTCKEAPIEAHWAIGKIERAHPPLRRSYDILKKELGHSTDNRTILQMAVKALNDTAGPDGIVPTLLVFGAYPRINYDSPPSTDNIARAKAISKAMTELRKINAQVDISRAINTRNGPNPYAVKALPLRSKVLVWREKEGWQGPYEIESHDGEDVILDMVNGPTRFRCTHVKPYYEPEVEEEEDTEVAPIVREPPPVRRRGRPRKSVVTDPEIAPIVRESPPVRKRGRPRKNAVADLEIAPIVQGPFPVRRTGRPQRHAVIHLTQKEKDNRTLAIKLREDGVITTPGAPFEESDAVEVNDLTVRGVFEIIKYDPYLHKGIRIFKTRLVREIKGKTTRPYEKSRLVVQGYGDDSKDQILTQAPTIQRVSQRLILVLGPTLIKSYGMVGELRDITQAYPQAHDQLARHILAVLPPELQAKYPEGTVLWIKKPLYGLAESGLYWFKTYHSHHTENLNMDTSTYDSCLLLSKDSSYEFGITALQTDDTLSFGTESFSRREEEEMQKAGFRTKPKTALSHDNPLEFNGSRIEMDGEDILFLQKGQTENLQIVDHRAEDAPQQYVSQRARGAYISSVCQPEAAYDLSTAAQVTEPEDTDIDFLNQRIQWQIDNPRRGLRFIPLDLARTKLYVFTDGSFANNRDLSSQLGFIVVLAQEIHRTKQEMTLRGNIVHWTSSKCKRVTRSVLASELYGMVNGFDIGIAICTTLRKITDRLELPRIPMVVCTDSFSVYDCLIKLGTTQEKRLMIDIMALRESYEMREISEIQWINGNDNPADACTKAKPNAALEKLVSTNQLTVRIGGYVNRHVREE
ncbi:hypothetical protein TruAng_012245 [Truncatella angustata]|nr:hypothetical protein TruAng_012245 [Truncatella angustata]